jgi:hypothetical protein
MKNLKKKRIEKLLGKQFPKGKIDQYSRSAGNDFDSVFVEVENRKSFTCNYMGNWADLYLGHNFHSYKIKLERVKAIHKNGKRYRV